MAYTDWRDSVQARQWYLDTVATTSRFTPTEVPVENPAATQQVEQLLSTLTERQREVAQLHGAASLSLTQAAEIIGIHRSTALYNWWRVVEITTGVTPDALERKRAWYTPNPRPPKQQPPPKPPKVEKPPKQRKVFVPPAHGTNSRYTNYRCHCELCVEAHRVALAEYRERRRLETGRDRAPEKPRRERTPRKRLAAEHGTITMYTEYRCRCEPCRQAIADYRREARRARKLP